MFELPETLVNVFDRWDTKLRTVTVEPKIPVLLTQCSVLS